MDIMQKNSRLIIVSFFLFFVSSALAAPSWQWIDSQRVMNYMNEGSGLWLIDVRSTAAYESGHVEGSVNIPSIVLKHKKFPLRKMLILFDDSLGQREAREAADSLVKKGHERVSVLEGGLAAWKSEGLPMVESKEPDRGVTAAELKWALANSVAMKIYDLRDAKTRKQGVVQGSEIVSGKTLQERTEKLKKRLANDGKKNLAARMKKPQPVVLIFAASDDAPVYTRTIAENVRGDIRYLIGGYESMITDRLRKQQTSGGCPTCPGGKRK